MSSSTTPTVTDVLVVGAGLSGLRAALAVQAAGLSCAVIEATDRVGGKTLSLPSKRSGPGVNDVGAAWINDTSQSEMYKLLRRYGLQGEFQLLEGKDIYLGPEGALLYSCGEMPIPEDDKAATSKAFTKVQQLAKSINLEDPASSPGAKELDQLTLQEYCIRTFESEFVTSLFNRISRSLLGLDSDEISLLSFVYYCKSGTGINALLSSRKNGAQYIRLREGTQTFSTNMAKELSPGSLYLSTPAAEIKQCSTSGQCTVVSSTGRCFTAKKVILSVPSPLYSTIRFDPPLPESKQSLAQSNRLGYYSKIIFVFDTPWWREAGFSGSTQASDGPIEFTVDTSISDDAQWSISCFIVGQRGRKWSQLSETERRRSAWEQLCASFQGAKAVSGKDFSIPEPINVLEYEWIKQDYFRGAPCPVAPPGLLCSIDGSASRAPFGSVHFVGTETSLEWKGYMEGAVRSGDRGAREVITVLKPGAEF